MAQPVPSRPGTAARSTGDLRASRAPLAGFVAMGAIWGTAAAMLPALRAQAGASDAALGLVFFLAACASLAAMLVAPLLGRRIGRRALPLATAMMLAAAVLPGLAGSVAALAGALAALGAASGVVDVLMNGRVAALEAARGRALMNLNHAAYSLAFFAAALLAGVARDAGAGAAPVFAALALLLAALLPATADPAPPETPPQAGAAPTDVARLGAAAWAAIGLGGAVILLASLLEAGSEAWSALHLERSLGAGPALAALGPAMLGLCMGLGRLGGQALSRRVAPLALLRAGAVLAAAGAAATAAAPGPVAALAGIAALALGTSVMVPTALTLVGAAAPRPELRVTLLARATALGFVGYVAGPAGMGLVAQAAGLGWGFALLAAAALGTLLPVAALARRARLTAG
jgi:MFS family permease